MDIVRSARNSRSRWIMMAGRSERLVSMKKPQSCSFVDKMSRGPLSYPLARRRILQSAEDWLRLRVAAARQPQDSAHRLGTLDSRRLDTSSDALSGTRSSGFPGRFRFAARPLGIPPPRLAARHRSRTSHRPTSPPRHRLARRPLPPQRPPRLARPTPRIPNPPHHVPRLPSRLDRAGM